MSIDECAEASDSFDACTLRIEYRADWGAPRALWRAYASESQQPMPAIAAAPPIIAPEEHDTASLPSEPDLFCEDEPAGRPEVAQTRSRTDRAAFHVPEVKPPLRGEIAPPLETKRRGRGYSPVGLVGVLTACTVVAAVGWRYLETPAACWLSLPSTIEGSGRLAADVVARKIVRAESGGDANARNTRSSATGAGQFLDGTWLDMIRAYRPDLTTKAEAEILDLRYDPDISREMVARFAEENAEMLVGRCLPVTPGTLYLAHFAGGAGAVAVLSAPETADAATTMAAADSTGRTTREMLVTANPFLKNYSVADLRRWAERKMGTHDGWPL